MPVYWILIMDVECDHEDCLIYTELSGKSKTELVKRLRAEGWSYSRVTDGHGNVRIRTLCPEHRRRQSA